MSADGPITQDGERLHDYLVRLAMEAFDGTMGGRLAIETALRERMAQAAQTIVCEVAEIERVAAESALAPGVAAVVVRERDEAVAALAALRTAALHVREALRGTSLEAGHEDACERLDAAVGSAASVVEVAS